MTDRIKYILFTVFGLALLGGCLSALATVLPEDRTDVMYHRYQGGGITIDGPSVLIRKKISNSVSINANYYVDSISSASIDVKVYASEASRYTEKRTEYTVGVDYLYNSSIMSLGYTTSTENDYDARTTVFGISQDFFGDLTNVTLSYGLGNNTIGETGNPDFRKESQRQNFRFGVSQIITSSLLLTLNYEAITDQGYLNNPYRKYRYVNPGDPKGYSFLTEVYPNTHTSDAAAFGAKYYLPYRAALGFNYRYFKDDWDIKADTFTLTYTHPIGDRWILDFSYRQYQQTDAYFYSDLHQTQSADSKDFRGRDRELSAFSSKSYGAGVSYEFKLGTGKLIQKSTISLDYNLIRFNYNDFRDLTAKGYPVGEEPLYSFNADVLRLFLSIWY